MQGDVLTPPFPEEKDPEGRGRQSTLFPQATWETPADPTKVLYADQVVQGLLMQSLKATFLARCGSKPPRPPMTALARARC